MIKGNESLVENFNSYFLTPLSHNFNMLHCDPWLQSYEDFVNAKNNKKQRNLNNVFANISKTIWPTSDSFLLIMSHFCNKVLIALIAFSAKHFCTRDIYRTEVIKRVPRKMSVYFMRPSEKGLCIVRYFSKHFVWKLRIAFHKKRFNVFCDTFTNCLYIVKCFSHFCNIFGMFSGQYAKKETQTRS